MGQSWVGMYCINTLSFFKEMHVQVIQYVRAHVQRSAQIGSGQGKTL